ncbi:unnamed protein product, partial [Rotaria sordida]
MKYYWRCENRSCHATLITTKCLITNKHSICSIGKNEHTHSASIAEQEVRVFREHVKKRAREELTPLIVLVEEEMRKLSLSTEAQQLLTLPEHMKAAFGRERRKCIPIIPQSLDFIIPYSYTLTRGHERFLLADEKTTNGGRILIFASNAQLNKLFKSAYVFCDGTFATVPSIFNQLYTFHAYHKSQVYPCAFALVSDRKTSSYEQMIKILKSTAMEMLTQFEPIVLMSDFEKSLIKAVKRQLPTTEHKGCVFHFNQRLHRRLASDGLAIAYRENEEIRKWSRCTMALAFLPPDEVENGWQLIKSSAPKKMKHFLRYVEDFWFKSVGINMWNVYSLKFRTNNTCE